MKLRSWLASTIVTGVTMFVVGLMFHILGPLIVADLDQHYENHDLFRDWNGWTTTYMFMHPFLYAPVFSAVFLLLPGASSLQSGVRYGFLYGAGVFCVGSLPIFLLMFASLQVPSEVIAAWVVQNLCQCLAAGSTLTIFRGETTPGLNVQRSASANDV